MNPPDVALVAPYPAVSGSHHAGSSGVASYSANLARSLAADGTTVHVVAPRGDARARTEDDGPRIRVERCFELDRAGLRRATDAVIASGAPVAHLQFELFLYGGPGSLVGVLGMLGRLRRHGIPTVVTLHQTVDPASVDKRYTELHRVSAPAPLARAGISGLQRAIDRAATAVVVHEEPFRNVVPGANVIPHGIEHPQRIDRDQARRDLGLDDRFIVLCFGFLAPYKGLETALDGVEAAGGDILAVVAGGDHPRLAADGDDYADRLRSRYGDSTHFTGWVPGGDVARWFCAADVALFPYPQPFSSSGALALALALDTPVLLSAPMARCIGAPSDLVASTTRELTDRLRLLADDPAAATSLRAWTSCLADGRSWTDVADRHLALYEEVAA